MVGGTRKKKNLLRLITLREIKRTPGRFFAIFAIIAISVGFFCGLRITTPVMVRTMDRFYQDTQLFDYRLLSSVGWTEKEVEDFRKQKRVKAAEGAWQYDVLFQDEEGEEEAYRVHSLTDRVNAVRLLEGRLPEKQNECLMDERNIRELSVGDQIRVSPANEEDTLEALKDDLYTITGMVDAPLYVNYERGSTSIGSGTISGYIYLPREAFSRDYYTEIYVKLDDGSEIYSDTYEKELDELRDDWEEETQEQADARRDELVGEAEEELGDARKEFEDKKEEGATELSDAEKELADAKQELADAKKELEDAEKELADAKEELDRGEKELQDAEEKLADAEKTLNNTYDELEKARTELADNKKKLDDAEKTLTESRAKLDETSDTLAQSERALADAEAELDKQEAELEAAIAAGLIDETTAQQMRAAIQAGRAELASNRAAYEAGRKEYESGEQAYAKGVAEYEAGMEAYAQGMEQYNDGVTKYNDGVAEYEKNRALFEESRQEFEDGKREYEEGLAEYEKGKKEYEDGLAEYADGEKEYEEGKETYDKEIRDAEEKLTDAEKELADIGEADSWLLERNTNIAYAYFENDSQIVRQIALVFPFFFLLVAALVCATTMTRMVEEQRVQTGTLKGLGYTPREILFGNMAYAGSAAVLGCVVGYAIGVFLFPTAIWKAYQIMYVSLPLRYSFSLKLFLGSLAASLLCSLGTAYAASRSALKESVAELMRPKSPKAGKRILLERVPSVWKRLSFMRKVSLRNIFLYKKRFFMMILGIGGCTALLLTAIGINDSVGGFAQEQYGRIEKADVELVFRDGEGEAIPDELTRALDKLQAESLACVRESWDMLYGRKVKSVNLIAPFDAARMDDYFVLRDSDGQALGVPEKDSALISHSLSSRFGIRKGDKIRLRNEDMQECEVEVTGVFENYIQNYVIVSPETVAGAVGTADANGLFVNLKEGSDPVAEQTALAACDCVSTVTLNEEMRNRLTSMMDALKYVIYLVILSAGALAFVVVFNLTNINIIERMREIATIKVLGFRRRETSDYIFRENLLLTLIGAAAGIVAGIFLHRFVMNCIVVDLVYFPRTIKPLSYVLAVVLTFFFTLLVNLFMNRRLDKINMAESLKAVE